ncbi:MAG: hypothetical protein QOK05_101 [Chloroflexota bacterium]|nr:hypothetical protein [Chloroflexota bacterium]
MESAAPELAASVRARFEAHGLALIATLRLDGSPRISGIEPLFALGELWFGMMPESRKAADLLQDSRFGLHSATTDKQVTQGDAKISGRAVEVTDDATVARYLEQFKAQAGYGPPPGPFHLFRADVLDISTVRPDGDHLDIDWWKVGGEVRHLDRR